MIADLMRRYLPRWLLGEVAQKLIGGITAPLDTAYSEAIGYARNRFAKTCDSTQLELIGQERQIPRGISQSEQAYRDLCARHLEFRRAKGTYWAMLWMLHNYLVDINGGEITVEAYDSRGRRYVVSTSGGFHVYDSSGWGWATGTEFIVRIILDADLLTPIPRYGDDTMSIPDVFEWGSPNRWGMAETQLHFEVIKHIVSGWKSLGSRCIQVLVPLSLSHDIPDASWSSWANRDLTNLLYLGDA